MKKVLWRIGALLFLAVSIYLITTVLRFKSPHGIDQKDGLYWQPEDSIDLVLLGSSHIHCGGNTVVLWEHYGIPAYDYSSAEQPLWMTYYYLQEFLKYQDPEIVFLDLYSPARFKPDYQYECSYRSLRRALRATARCPPRVAQHHSARGPNREPPNSRSRHRSRSV